ncbi:sensor histidine kinase [Nonomuraea jiangxiensis]|uniref:histidine kinase n=1 Tax=Nonomuraea jiangxiensis TaxID=633440 RepID=A0A1G9ANR7_9ACTN|nr:histidine kinase [Nonomuraea jiangxiensis]SDK29009.1 Signal transduction histidine kinase [Nonomuraea jiangxiensis]
MERRGARSALAGLRGHEIIEIGAPEWERLRTYIQADLVGVVVAAAWLTALRFVVVFDDWLIAIVSLLLVMAAFLVRAIHMIHRYRRFAAVVVFATANWVVAILVTAIVPFALATLALAVLLPVLVAVQHMNHARLSAMLGATMLAGTALVVVGRVYGGVGVAAPAPVTHALAIVFIPFITVLVSLAAWQNHVMLVARAEALQESRARLVAAADRERREIERNLRDGAQQRLVAAAEQARLAQCLLATRPDRVGPLLGRLSDDLQEASAELRKLAHGIYPPQLAQYGLETALRAVAQHSPLPTTVNAVGIGRYPPEIEINIYFCLLEALQNATKHAGGQATVTIALLDRNGLSFDFRDTGRGASPAHLRAGDGMINMNDRLGAIGGTLTIDTRSGGGMRLHGHLPRSALESAGVRRSTREPGRAVRAALVGTWQFIARLYTGVQRTTHPHPQRYIAAGLWTMLGFALGAGALALLGYAATGLRWSLAAAAGCGVAALLILVTLRLLRRQRVERAIAISAAITWCFALGLTAMVPDALPYATLVTVAPVLLSVAYLRRQRFKLVMACTVGTAVAITLAGRYLPGIGLGGHGREWLVDLLVIALVVLGFTRASFLAWQNHVMLVARAEDLQESRARLVAAADRERREIERNLHDGAQQRLVAAAVQSRVAQRLLATQPDRVGPLLGQLTDDLQEAGADLRDLAHGIYPPQLAQYGLETALRAVAQHSPLPTTVNAVGIGRYAPEIEINLYFCLLEAMQNAIKHAGEKATVTIDLRDQDGLSFDFRDDGVGGSPQLIRSGHGITNMYDRLGAIGGTLTIDTSPGAGVHLHGDIPAGALPGTPACGR